MPFQIRPAAGADRPAWDAFVLGGCGGLLLQTWAWGELRAAQGWTVERLVAVDGSGDVMGALQVQLRRGPGPVGFAYAPRGPAVADLAAGAAVAEALIAAGAAIARRHRSLVFKLDPEWRLRDPAASAVFRAAGARPSWYDIQHRVTWLVDLAGGADAVLGRIKSSTRRNIRLAERAGVEVSLDPSPAAVADFHPLLLETAGRTGLVTRPEAYYRAAVAGLATSCPVRVLVARVGGEPAAAMIAVAAGPRLIYLYGGSTPRLGRHHPAYLLHWTAIRWGLEQGCATYDMWGVPSHEDPDAPGGGYYEFKTRWNGELVRFHRCHEVPLWPALGPLPRLAERVALRGRPVPP